MSKTTSKNTPKKNGVPCRFPGCSTKKSLDKLGLCANHKMDALDENPFKEDFQKLHEKMDDMLAKLNSTIEENKRLKEEVKSLKKENEDIKSKVRLNFYRNDADNQYGRRECLRIHNYPESSDPTVDNSMDALQNVAKK